MWVGLHPMDWEALVLLGPSQGGLGGPENLDGMPIHPEQRFFLLILLLYLYQTIIYEPYSLLIRYLKYFWPS